MTAGATERESTMRVNGLELFVRERGAGAPILMLNGLGSNADMWGAVEDELSIDRPHDRLRHAGVGPLADSACLRSRSPTMQP